MRRTLYESDFVSEFDRFDRSENFSKAARRALFQYFEEIDPDMELDIIAICCEFSEYDDAISAAKGFGFEPSDPLDDDASETEAARWLDSRTTVISFPGGVVVGSF